jgi:hypothetical protein
VNDIESSVDPRPTDPRTGEPLPPRDQPGYYPGFSTLAQQRFWDATTQRVVLERVESPSQLQHFDADEERFWTVVFEHLIPQSDRTRARRIPILNVVDHRLATDRSVGYRFADMPPDREAYTLGRAAIDEESSAAHQALFVELDFAVRDAILKRIHDGKPQRADAIWKRMSVHRFWQLIIGDAIDAYYAHPWAWDEIGFGGPAYPRAYTRLERGEPEPWEVCEQRYDWASPAAAVSHETENAHEFHTEAEQHRSHVAKAASA